MKSYCKCKRPKRQRWYVLETNEELCARCIDIIELKCNYCNRLLPNKEHKTSSRCIWCDSEYHQNRDKL